MLCRFKSFIIIIIIILKDTCEYINSIALFMAKQSSRGHTQPIGSLITYPKQKTNHPAHC
jgi:hypothetical protein